jgi:hypothetical protein
LRAPLSSGPYEGPHPALPAASPRFRLISDLALNFLQVLACHYVPAGYRHWPHILWERIDFDGIPRWSDGADTDSEAARINARLPPHPGMLYLRQPFCPSIFPARREGLRLCSTAQVQDMDTHGFTVMRSAVGAEQLCAIREEVDRLEAARWPPEQQRVGANAGSSTFSQGLVEESQLLRNFCSSQLFCDLCYDILHVDTAWLINEQSVYKQPQDNQGGSDGVFPYHQDAGYSLSEPLQLLTAWVALSDAPEESGCPIVIPKLHRCVRLL